MATAEAEKPNDHDFFSLARPAVRPFSLHPFNANLIFAARANLTIICAERLRLCLFQCLARAGAALHRGQHTSTLAVRRELEVKLRENAFAPHIVRSARRG